jgi:hypothetical protein
MKRRLKEICKKAVLIMSSNFTEPKPNDMKRCKNCKWRVDGYCKNDNKIDEDYGQIDDDCLVYSYCEGGRFKVGPNFGCVHFKEKEKE